jgi:hypothetical protein
MNINELTEMSKANLIRMKGYAQQYLEAVKLPTPKELLDGINENYQNVRMRAKKYGADVSKYPESLEELTK